MIRPLLAIVLLASALPALSGGAGEVFRDVTSRAGLGGIRLVSGSPAKDYILETLGTGAAAFDMDNDGDQDVYLANGSRLEKGAGVGETPRLLRNRGDGTFEEITAGSGLDVPMWGFGVAVGDYDNDGFSDLYVTAWGPNRLFRNRGDATFEEVGRRAGVDDARWGASAAFLDIDGDALPDLYVTNYVGFDPRAVPRRGDPDRPCMYRGSMVMCGPTGLAGEVDILYRNNGDGTFTDVTAKAGIRTDIGMFGLGVATADYDADGDIDIYVANDATPNQLYRNRGDGTFEEIGAMTGAAYSSDGIEQGSMGTGFGDYDGDGRLDLVVTNFSHQFYQVLRASDEGFFEDVAYATGLADATFLKLGWATEFFDYDNDGFLDLFFANGHVYPGVDEMQIGTTYRQQNQLMRNVPAPDGGRSFSDVSAEAGEGFRSPASYRTGGTFDSDGDGDLDLLLTIIDERPILLANQVGAQKGHWLELSLTGTASNRSAIGARVILTAGGRRQFRHAGDGSFLWSTDRRIHFGLGEARTIDSVEVVWPGGRSQRFTGLEPDGIWRLVEGRDRPERITLGKRAEGG